MAWAASCRHAVILHALHRVVRVFEHVMSHILARSSQGRVLSQGIGKTDQTPKAIKFNFEQTGRFAVEPRANDSLDSAWCAI